MNKIKWEKLSIDEDIEVLDEDDEYKEVVGSVIDTGNGILSINNSLHPLKQYNFWIGHTNFWISEKHFHLLRFAEGVEVIKVVSPYRFIVAPGKMFDEVEVKQRCERVLECYSPELRDIKVGLDTLREYLEENFEKWAIYVWPNGNTEHITGASKEFEMRLDIYKECEKLSSGLLLTND